MSVTGELEADAFFAGAFESRWIVGEQYDGPIGVSFAQGEAEIFATAAIQHGAVGIIDADQFELRSIAADADRSIAQRVPSVRSEQRYPVVRAGIEIVVSGDEIDAVVCAQPAERFDLARNALDSAVDQIPSDDDQVWLERVYAFGHQSRKPFVEQRPDVNVRDLDDTEAFEGLGKSFEGDLDAFRDGGFETDSQRGQRSQQSEPNNEQSASAQEGE